MNHIYKQENFGENWFTYPIFYSDMVKKFPHGSEFVEVGSWKGKSSSYMAVEIANSNKKIEFTCIDTWEGSSEHVNLDLSELYELFKNNMKPVENYYRSIRMASIHASRLFENNSLDFVFIDASHEYSDVKNDILAWKPKVKKDGILAGHDYDAKGVDKAINELLYNQFYITEGCWVHSII